MPGQFAQFAEGGLIPFRRVIGMHPNGNSDLRVWLGQRDGPATLRQVNAGYHDAPYPGLTRPRQHCFTVRVEVVEVEVAMCVRQQINL